VFNVTSDPAASVSFQATQPKPARPDPSQLNDSFGALVDSSLPPDTGAVPVPPQRRADDATASQDNSRPRDTSADQPAQNASDDRNASAQRASDGTANANADANTAPAPRSKAKSDSSKDGSAKTTDKPSSDKASATDQATPAQQGIPSATTPNPVAVAIQVTVASTDVAAAPAATGNPTAPLAIAAAAIAAASAPAAAAQAAASPAQIKADPGTATADGASATANSAAAAMSGKTVVQAAAATSVVTTAKQPATQADATTAADTGLSAAIAAAAPAAPKATLLKTPGAVQSKGTASATPDTKSAKSDPATTDALGSTLQTNATPAAANAKPQAGADGADAAKVEANAASASVSAASTHDHAPVNATAAQTSTDALDSGSQLAGAIQPQLPAAVAAAAPAPALNVTAATNAPVPLSGLAVEIAASATAGKSHFEIRLDPADLGRIDVRIDVDHNGQVTSHLTVEKPETLSTLRQDAPQLQRALDDAGFKTGDSGLQFSLRDQSSSGQNNGNDSGRNAQRLVISEDDTIPAVTAGRTYGRMLGSSSGVDIRV